MTFDAPLLLALSPVVALLLAAATWWSRSRRIRLARNWSRALEATARSYGRWAPLVLGLVGLLATVALAGPRGGRTSVTTETRALSLVLAMDISRSMLAEDVAPSRLARATREARRLIEDLAGDRIGLIAFAGRSYILAPLTVDGGAVRMYLDALDPDLASEGGTSLAAVLTQGGQLLSAATEDADRVLVLFSDGEAHDSLPAVVAAASRLREARVRLIVVAQGGTVPARIPIRDSAGTLIEYKLDADGSVVRTRRRDDVLQAVVDAADGALVPSELADQAGAVRDLVSAMKRSPTTETRTADLVPRAWIPILAATLLLFGYTVTRRGAALIGLAGVTLAGSAAAQRPSEGDRAMAAGKPAEAAAAYLRDAAAARARDTVFYNAGTAALEAGRLDVAKGALLEASKSLDPAIRYRALYNLGLAALLQSRADTARRTELLEEAERHLRQALLLEPSSQRAKWNLELALREEPPPSGGGSGGGGGGGSPQPPSGGGQQDRRQEPSVGGLTRSQAEQILNSMERQERATRADQQRRLQASSPAGVKDW